MEKRISIYFIGLCLLLYALQGKATHIYGTAKDYANFELVFFTYSDFLTEKTDTLFTLHVNSKGEFNHSFELNETKPVFTLVGIHKIWFIAEPDGDYELVFPDYIEKNKAEIYNPFFKPILLMVGIKGQKKNDLNRMINAFDYEYNNILRTHLLDFISQGKNSDIEKYIDTLKNKYAYNQSEYFNVWKNFRFATMRRIAYEKNHRFVINQYFSQESIHYQNPAYMNLFLELFANYFDRFLLRPDGKALVEAIDKGKSPHLISKILSPIFELSDPQFREFVIIKGLQDAYSSPNFKSTSVLMTLDSIADYSQYSEHKIIAKNIATNFRHMKKGTLPPNFAFEDINGNKQDVNTLKNRYLYIAFYQTELPSCQKEIAVLKELYVKHKENFDVLFLVFDEDKEQALSNLKSYDLPFEVYFPLNREFLKKQWKIRTFPTYYLLDVDGKLIFSPAPSPTEYFENYFFNYIGNKKQ